jgi:hypothetical protein
MTALCMLFLAGCGRAAEQPAGASEHGVPGGTGNMASAISDVIEAETGAVEAKKTTPIFRTVIGNGETPVNISGCAFGGDGNANDSVRVGWLSGKAEAAASENEVLITVEHDGGDAFTQTFPGRGGSDLFIYVCDLTGDGSDELVVCDTSATSTYGSSDVHVYQIDEYGIKESLTVLDCPSARDLDLIAQYRGSFFEMPQPENNFGIPDDLPGLVDKRQSDICTGILMIQRELTPDANSVVMIVTHLQKYGVVPFTAVAWAGERWTVLGQSYVHGEADHRNGVIYAAVNW